jgi:secreted Zn-dependent insulinase-like peptidase
MLDDNNEINLSNIQDKAWELMKNGSIRSVMGGSIRLKTAHKVVTMIDSIFGHRREFKIRRIKNELFNADTYDPTNGYTERIRIIENKNADDTNIGILYGIHLGEYVRSEYDPKKNPREIRDMLIYNSVMSMINERFFNTMRTEKELGYIVMAGTSLVYNTGSANLFMDFVIQTHEKNILDIIRNYVNDELVNIIHEFGERDLQNYVNTYIDNAFSDPSNIGEKLNDAISIQSNLSYDELEMVGTTVFLNRLRALDALREIRALTVDQVHDLMIRAIRNRPRYIIQIVPKN